MTDATRRPFVLVTGGTRRIGRAIAHGLSAAGYAVFAQTRQEIAAEDAASLPPGLIVLRHSTDTCGQMRALVAAAASRAHSQGGWLAGVVANASQFEFDVADDRSDAMLCAHIDANFSRQVAAWRELLWQTKSYVSINPGGPRTAFFTAISDQVAHNPNHDFFSYAMSKGAWSGVLRQLALCGAPYLRTNLVLPGLVLPGGAMDDERFRAQHSLTPLGLGPNPGDIASACRFLADSHCITGQQISVDGGRHLALSDRDPAFNTSASS